MVVHAAALSSPKVCERDPAAAVANNSPELLLDALHGTTQDAFVVRCPRPAVTREAYPARRHA